MKNRILSVNKTIVATFNDNFYIARYFNKIVKIQLKLYQLAPIIFSKYTVFDSLMDI